ncbi:MAG TPA: helix-turn-helix transcriptional regulator [Streptosporangiaceae bacterium]|nr:helix-turn-helix transcriptional regulator [Streptosporangiaceae bacterium]
MSDDAYGATVAKRRLSRRLTELRRASGHTANHVCDLLDWGRGKVGRFEANHWKRPEMSDIRDLLRVYGVNDEDRAELEGLAMKARIKPWWRDYSDVFENEFAGFENDAASIRVCMPLLVPGLLQTRDYAEAVLRVAPKPPVWRERATEARMRRQHILDRIDRTAPKLVAVITEASLMYRWGTKAERREQIDYLVKAAEHPNVELRIQRFADGPHRGLWSMIDIFDFEDDEPSVVFLESDTAIQEVTADDDVMAYVEGFSRSRDSALEPADTTQYLKYLGEQLE